MLKAVIEEYLVLLIDRFQIIEVVALTSVAFDQCGHGRKQLTTFSLFKCSNFKELRKGLPQYCFLAFESPAESGIFVLWHGDGGQRKNT